MMIILRTLKPCILHKIKFYPLVLEVLHKFEVISKNPAYFQTNRFLITKNDIETSKNLKHLCYYFIFCFLFVQSSKQKL